MSEINADVPKSAVVKLLRNSTPSTQKGIGCKALSLLKGSSVAAMRGAYLVGKEEVDALLRMRGAEAPLCRFARPCPPIPVHGFLESRMIHTVGELADIAEEFTKTGAPVEILLMDPLLPAKWSAVVTPNSVALGANNDGVTGGAKSYFLPVPVDIQKLCGTTLYPEKGKVPFLEVVRPAPESSPSSAYPDLQFVQLREGPPVVTPDYIPFDVEVKEIITPASLTTEQVMEAGGELIAWQKFVALQKEKEGLVLFLDGASVTSHWAIHCVENKIPVISTYEPKVGMKLKKPEGDSEPTKRALERFAKYLRYMLRHGTKHKNRKLEDELAVCMAGVHSLGTFRTLSHGECRILAASLEGLVRVTFALGCGEMRYWPSNGPGGSGYAAPPLLKKLFTKGKGMKVSSSMDYRAKIYKRRMRDSFTKAILSFPFLIEGFSKYGWSSSYGGVKWGDGMEKGLTLAKVLLLFCSEPTLSNLKLTRSAANSLADAVHNGGKLHNKVAAEDQLNLAASSPGNFFVSDTAWNWLTMYPRKSPEMYPKSFLTLVKKVEKVEKVAQEMFKTMPAVKKAPTPVTPAIPVEEPEGQPGLPVSFYTEGEKMPPDAQLQILYEETPMSTGPGFVQFHIQLKYDRNVYPFTPVGLEQRPWGAAGTCYIEASCYKNVTDSGDSSVSFNTPEGQPAELKYRRFSGPIVFFKSGSYPSIRVKGIGYYLYRTLKEKDGL